MNVSERYTLSVAKPIFAFYGENMTSDQLLTLLQREIPLSLQMQIQIESLGEDELVLHLPLPPNKNHKGTLFGGSLYAASALACYGLFLSSLQNQGIFTQNIVLADGDIRYLAPAESQARVIASWPSHEEKRDFFSNLKKKGKARISMKAELFCDSKKVCEFSGRFVAFYP